METILAILKLWFLASAAVMAFLLAVVLIGALWYSVIQFFNKQMDHW